MNKKKFTYKKSGVNIKAADKFVDFISTVSAKEKNKILLENNGNRSVESFHRDLGKIVWDYCGMSRNESSLVSAIDKIKDFR